VRGAENAVARGSRRGIAAVPWDGHKATLELLRPELAGKIVIDCVHPMGFDKRGAFALPVAERQRRPSRPPPWLTEAPWSPRSTMSRRSSARTLMSEEVELDVLVLGEDVRPPTWSRAGRRIPVYAASTGGGCAMPIRSRRSPQLISINRGTTGPRRIPRPPTSDFAGQGGRPRLVTAPATIPTHINGGRLSFGRRFDDARSVNLEPSSPASTQARGCDA